MDFYSQIVEAYDAIFPLNEKQLSFVENACGGVLSAKSVLDVGCGTGSLSIAMARRDARVRSFDFDPEMIAKAEEKRPQALDLTFKQGDMLMADTYFAPLTFDVALCFGNTLVHLSSDEAVEQAVKAMASCVKEGGKLLLQIVNYDRVMAQKVKSLPTITTEQYSFVRDYNWRDDNKINFDTTLKMPSGEVKNSVPLLMLTKKQLSGVLQQSFKQVECFGGFERSEWSEDSFHLVIEATK